MWKKISKVPLNMFHNIFIYLHNKAKVETKDEVSKREFNLNEYLTRTITRKIEKYYREHSLTKFIISYDEVSNNIYPVR